MYKAVGKRQRVYEQVVKQITDLIMSNNLCVGDKLPSETQLTRELAVSRTALREAIKALEQKGLLEVRHGSGTFVRNIRLEEVSESFSLLMHSDISRYFQVLQLRGILEVEIVGHLAEMATERDIEILCTKIEEMRKALHSPREYAKADVEFHLSIYRALGNEVLMSIVQPMTALLSEVIELTFDPPGTAQRTLQRHEELVRYIRARNPEGGRRVMREIIARGEQRLKEARSGKGAELQEPKSDHESIGVRSNSVTRSPIPPNGLEGR